MRWTAGGRRWTAEWPTALVKVPGPVEVRVSSLAGAATRRALVPIIDGRSRRSRRPSGLILMYHGVAETSGDPDRWVVAPLGVQVLREQLQHLRRRYEVVSLQHLPELVAARQPRGRIPVALTFDDDLASHLRYVAPVLSELELPATFFLTGASLDEPHAFYWQDLEDLYARGGAHWQQVRREVDRRWPHTDSEISLQMVELTMSTMPPDDRDLLADRLREILDSPPRDGGLSAADVSALAGAGFEIGFHTKGHYWLQRLDDETLHREMQGAERLSAVTGAPLKTIAYPYGPGDLRIAAAAARAEFELGVVWTNTAVSEPHHPLLLDRVDGAWSSAAEFAFRMARFVSAVT